MQEIEFYCKKCRKSMKMSYTLTGDKDAPAMNGISILDLEYRRGLPCIT